MSDGISLAWSQLRREKKRMAAAIAGITFAVVLMLVQLGFEEALMTSAGVHVNALQCDLILATPNYQYLLQPGSFPERRLYQAAGDPRIESIAPLYLTGLPLSNPVTRKHRMILVIGTQPRRGIFAVPEIDNHIESLRDPEAALYDASGRTEYGPVVQAFHAGRPVDTELANRRVAIVGLFNIGTTFGVDGTIIVSDLAFRRMAPIPGVNIGVIRLKNPGDAEQVRNDLAARLPADVVVYTRKGFILREQDYWSTNTPVGFLFKLGVGMGLFVGLIIVYQILYTDVMEHLTEYATLKAIGYTDGYLVGVVLRQGLILSALGFVPGAVLALFIYKVTAAATFLPIGMTGLRMTGVYLLTVLFCLLAASLSIRPLLTADPAEIL